MAAAWRWRLPAGTTTACTALPGLIANRLLVFYANVTF